VSVEVSETEHGLKKEHARSPDGWSPSEPGEHESADERLHEEKEECAEEHHDPEDPVREPTIRMREARGREIHRSPVGGHLKTLSEGQVSVVPGISAGSEAVTKHTSAGNRVRMLIE
jgi:hypothetical protein